MTSTTCQRSRPSAQSGADDASSAQLLDALRPLGRTMAGLALLSDLRRGELFALRWQDVDEHDHMLRVRDAVHERGFDTPKTVAGLRHVLRSDGAPNLIADWKSRVKRTGAAALVCSTWSGKPI